MLSIGRERRKGQIGKIPKRTIPKQNRENPRKIGKVPKRTKKKGRTSPDRETPPFETPPWRPLTIGRGRGRLATRFARIDSRESFAMKTPIFIACQADSLNHLEFPIRANHPIRADRANFRFARITPLRRTNRAWPRYCRKVCWTKRSQNGLNDRFGPF